MIELNKPGGVLREYRYALNPAVLSALTFSPPDLNALLVSGTQVVPHTFLMCNETDDVLESPTLVLNSVLMNYAESLNVGRCVHYFCNGVNIIPPPEWSTGGNIQWNWSSWGGGTGFVYLFVYVTLFPLSILV